ncbi:hypothetical protein [Escherichia coli]|uniref:hypothetical protein n=1 Tax=Escherichia coli TaxID=562 RepID=UPI0010EBC0C2|nr:hypothetical protein [Escherichia coli]GDT84917.1 receptor recognizing protein [Escherichia coli]
MGVTSGWVGSSAKSETGEQWMGAAGTKLGLGKSFMMSQMVGRSMGCKIATAYYKGNPPDKVENWGAVGSDWPLAEKNKGTITGASNCGLGRLVGIVLTQAHFITGVPPTAALYIAGGRASNITVTVGGVSQVFTYNSVINDLHYYWQGTPGSAFIVAMKKTGVTQDLKIS